MTSDTTATIEQSIESKANKALRMGELIGTTSSCTAVIFLRRLLVAIHELQRCAATARLLPVTRAWGEEALTAHRAFHQALYRASHNDVLIRMLDDLWGQV